MGDVYRNTLKVVLVRFELTPLELSDKILNYYLRLRAAVTTP